MNNSMIKKIIAFVGIAALGFLLWNSRSTEPGSTALAPNVASAAVIHSDCEAKPQPKEKTGCYKAAFEVYMKQNGGKKTLILLDDLQNLGGYAKSNCHPLSHIVGNIALHVYGSVPKASPEYLPVCHSGYYHGLLEEYLATAPSYEEGVAKVCGSPKENYFNWFQCTHGLGHGIMQFRDDEVPQSVKDCDILDPEYAAREICYTGAFMENITTEEKTGHKSKYTKPENPLYPCDIVERQYKSSCYFLSSSMILKLNGWNFEQGFKWCDKAEADFRHLCYQSMGRDVAGSTLRNDQESKRLCLYGGSEDARNNCYFGAVRDYINEKGEFDSAIRFCKFIDADYQQYCYNGIFVDLALLQKGETFLATCAKIPEPFRADCRSRVVY
ncbi:MAG: hypothetical protein HYV13_01145 [Candidatus Doudnabacteria bacterium]|nr:hypothetical protein [Candidatus Doudnabacteria bacterium]